MTLAILLVLGAWAVEWEMLAPRLLRRMSRHQTGSQVFSDAPFPNGERRRGPLGLTRR